MSEWQRFIPARLRRDAVAGAVNDELAFHLDMRAQEYVERGMTPEAARAEALRRMGDLDTVRVACRALGEARERDMRRAEWFEEMAQDIRFAVRQLAHVRGLTAVVAITLALGIGATAAIFGVVDAVVLRPLPFDHPERVVQLRATAPEGTSAVSSANFLDWRAHGTAWSFEAMAAFVGTGLTLSGREVPELLDGVRVSADYFRVFGVRPMLGRVFLPEEDEAGRGSVVVLSARAWNDHFGGDSSVVGRSIRLNDAPHTIVGVMPPSFDYVEDSPALWVPLALPPAERMQRGAGYLTVVGRLKPGVAVAAAQATMDQVAGRLARDFPEFVSKDAGVRVRTFAAELTGDYPRRILTLFGAVAFVLLIGCANVANLLLARGAARAKELAVRSALGAGRARLVRQLLAEGAVLALLGGVLGAALAVGGVRALVAISPPGVPRLEQASVDGRVLAFTLLLSLASSLVFALAPALWSVRADLQPALREGGRGTAPAVHDRLRSWLVVAEVALALVLLTGAGLLTRSAVLLHRVTPGFDPSGVLTARIMLPEAAYAEGERVVAAYRRIGDEVRRVPAVSDAGFTLMVPLAADDARGAISAEGQPFTNESRIPVPFRLVSEGYFASMRIPIRAGRDFTERDDASSPRVAILNEALAARLWPGEDPIGKRVTGLTASPDDPQFTEIIGIVRDVHDKSLDESPRPVVYYPVAQTPPRLWPILQRSLVLVARSAAGAGSAGSLERPLRAAVARVDSNLPLGTVRSMEEYVAASLATARFTSLLLGTLSAIGLVLAAVGIYGIIAYFVTQRRSEISVRMALGATPRAITSLVVRAALRPVVIGLVIGAAAAMALTRLLRAYLFGVSATDPVTIVGVIVLLLGAGLLASLVPARRATHVDPAGVMRG